MTHSNFLTPVHEGNRKGKYRKILLHILGLLHFTMACDWRWDRCLKSGFGFWRHQVFCKVAWNLSHIQVSTSFHWSCLTAGGKYEVLPQWHRLNMVQCKYMIWNISSWNAEFPLWATKLHWCSFCGEVVIPLFIAWLYLPYRII